MRKVFKLILIIFLMFLFFYKITYSEEKNLITIITQKTLIEKKNLTLESLTSKDHKFLNRMFNSIDSMPSETLPAQFSQNKAKTMNNTISFFPADQSIFKVYIWQQVKGIINNIL